MVLKAWSFWSSLCHNNSCMEFQRCLRGKCASLQCIFFCAWQHTFGAVIFIIKIYFTYLTSKCVRCLCLEGLDLFWAFFVSGFFPTLLNFLYTVFQCFCCSHNLIGELCMLYYCWYGWHGKALKTEVKASWIVVLNTRNKANFFF